MRGPAPTRDRVGMFPRRLVVMALLFLSALVGGTPLASAAGGLTPGGTQSFSVSLPATWTAQADRLGVSVVDLVQAENECLEPERKAGDDCRPAGGDLAGQLLVTIAAGTLEDGSCEVSGPYVPLDLLDAEAQAILTVDGAECLAARLDFPHGDDDNLAQSDTISFGLRTVAEGSDGVSPGPGNTTAQVDSTGTAPGGSAGGGNAVRQRVGSGVGTPGRTGTGASGTAPSDTAPSETRPSGTGSTALGEQTTRVDMSNKALTVETESSASSFGDPVQTWGSLFLGVVALGFAAFLWWSRRRAVRRSAA